MQYKRNIQRQLLIKRSAFALLLAGAIILIACGKYVYLTFIVVTYLILDFVFPSYQVSITEINLTITRVFLGGLFERKIRLQKDKITKVENVDVSITTNSEIDFEYGVFAPTDTDNNTRKYEVYKLIYLDVATYKLIKVPLLQIEADILRPTILPTTPAL